MKQRENGVKFIFHNWLEDMIWCHFIACDLNDLGPVKEFAISRTDKSVSRLGSGVLIPQ